MKIIGTVGDDDLRGTDAGDLIYGLDGDDGLLGGAGNDRIEGGRGRDRLYGGAGDDMMLGGADSDFIRGGEIGNDRIFGEAGDDSLYFSPGSEARVLLMDGGVGDDYLSCAGWGSDRVTAFGGDGGDVITISGVGSAMIDAGAGDDRLTISAYGNYGVTLGAGADSIKIEESRYSYTSSGAIIVNDFATGVGGDRLDIVPFLISALRDWDQNANPFATGHLRLVQKGTASLLQIDTDGTGAGQSYATLVTFKNTAAAAFTAENLGGYPSDGKSAPGKTITGDARENVLTGTIGDDLIRGLGGNDILNGGSGNDHLEGGSGENELDGGLGNDTLVGGDESDSLTDNHGGSDRLYGRGGSDDLSMSRSGDPASTLLLDGGAGIDDIYYFGNGLDKVTAIGGSDRDRIEVTGALSTAIDAGDGNDRVTIGGFEGRYWITLGTGADRLVVTRTNHPYTADNMIVVNDFATGVGGDRLLSRSFLFYELQDWDPNINPFATGHMRIIQSGTASLLQIDRDAQGGDYGYVTVVTLKNTTASAFTAENLVFDPKQASVVFFGTASNDRFSGGTVADTLLGGAGNDTLAGLGGHDTLDGGTGIDLLLGGAGNDVYVVDNASDVVDEAAAGSAGIDLVQSLVSFGLAASSRVRGEVENLTLLGTATVNGYGTQTGNVIVGNAAANALNGDAGNDTMSGGLGNDLLIGGLGLDSLTGGGGKDQFRFLSEAESGATAATADRILDFAVGDRIDIAAIDANGAGAGNAAFVLDLNASFSLGEIRQTVTRGNTLVEFNTDTDAAAEMAILLVGHGALGSGDFLL